MTRESTNTASTSPSRVRSPKGKMRNINMNRVAEEYSPPRLISDPTHPSDILGATVGVAPSLDRPGPSSEA